MSPYLIALAFVIVFGLAAVALFRLRGRAAEDMEEGDQPPISIVALLKEPQRIEPIYVVKAAEKGWKADLGTGLEGDDSGEDGFVVGTDGMPTTVVQYKDEMFLVNNFNQNYFDDVDAVVDSLVDLRLKTLVGQHTAWLSVDAMGVDANDEQAVRRQYHLLGTLITELIDDNCVALLFPAAGSIFPNMEETLEALKSPDPLEALEIDAPVPVVQISGDDPRMQAAVEEARSRFPEFVAALEKRTGENYAVKAPISAGGNTEFIWISVTAIEQNVIYGELANDPIDLAGLECGSRVRTSVDELNDWIYFDEQEEMQGGFTVKVLTDEAKRQQE